MTNKYHKLYLVGGTVRDRLLGVQPKDIDYSFEFTPEFLEMIPQSVGTPTFFYITMNNMLKAYGFEMFLETLKCFTTRAKFPKGHQYEGITADFVMCRKETYEDPESRQPTVQIGTLYDDLQRRDFTLNAIAEDEDGNLIDPFGGQEDLKNMVLRCPVNAETSFMDDPLRMIRALRFAVTKDFTFSKDVKEALQNESTWNKFFEVVSHERIREELLKMYKFNTHNSNIILYHSIPGWVSEKIFTEVLWLNPTTEKRKK